MPTFWARDMSQASIDQLKRCCALTPALVSDRWNDIATAPKDGTEIELRVVHINAAYENDVARATEVGWIGTCRGHWTDFNGGGWTWNGLCGQVCQWRWVIA